MRLLVGTTNLLDLGDGRGIGRARGAHSDACADRRRAGARSGRHVSAQRALAAVVMTRLSERKEDARMLRVRTISLIAIPAVWVVLQALNVLTL